MDHYIFNTLTAINRFMDGFFFGFSFVTIWAMIITLLKPLELLTRFINRSIDIAKIVALAYLLYYFISTIYYFSSDANIMFNERATGPYAWAYWAMLLRPFIFCGLIQLFWLYKFKAKTAYALLLLIIIGITVSLSGSAFERFVILVSSYHRDYAPQLETNIFIILIWHILKNSILYSAIVLMSLALFKDKSHH